MQAFEGGLQLIGRPAVSDTAKPLASATLRDIPMLSEETPPASWFETGVELAEGKDLKALRTFVRTTLREIRDQVPAKVAELNVVTSDNRVAVDKVAEEAVTYERQFSPLVAHLEEFALGLASSDWPQGAQATLECAGALVTAGELTMSGLRFATGLPAFFAWRLVIVSGAAAVHNEAWSNVATLINDPIPVGGSRRTYRSLRQHRDLFHPEALLGYADLGVKQLDRAYERASYLEPCFASQEDYQEALAKFLILVALCDVRARTDNSNPLYPGYRLLEGYRDARHLLAGLWTRLDKAAAVAAILGLSSSEELRLQWPELARVANESRLGSSYYTGSGLPVDIDGSHDVGD